MHQISINTCQKLHQKIQKILTFGGNSEPASRIAETSSKDHQQVFQTRFVA